ncbi:MAG: cation transporting ATPase C-terminal domain-containing protein, partial [Methanobacterium sp.]
DGPPAQSLGVEPPEKGVMERSPRKEEIIPRPNLYRIIIAGIVMSVGTLALYLYEISVGVSFLKATSIAFTVFVMFQIFNVFNCKSGKLFSNRFLFIAIGLSLLLQLCVIYIPFFQGIFRTTALSGIDWLLILLVSFTILIIDWLVGKIQSKKKEE